MSHQRVTFGFTMSPNMCLQKDPTLAHSFKARTVLLTQLLQRILKPLFTRVEMRHSSYLPIICVLPIILRQKRARVHQNFSLNWEMDAIQPWTEFSKDQLRLLDSEKSRLPRPIRSLLDWTDWTPGFGKAMRPGIVDLEKTWDESTMGVESWQQTAFGPKKRGIFAKNK